jgi:hypothetical protein
MVNWSISWSWINKKIKEFCDFLPLKFSCSGENTEKENSIEKSNREVLQDKFDGQR